MAGVFKVAVDPQLAGHLRENTATGVRLVGELILQEARTRVPIEEGTLERSGRVDGTDPLHLSVGFHTPYAARQHEDLTYRHDSGRSAKYLEKAVDACKARGAAIIAQAGQDT